MLEGFQPYSQNPGFLCSGRREFLREMKGGVPATTSGRSWESPEMWEAQAPGPPASRSDPGLTLKGRLRAGGGQKALGALAAPYARCPATPSWGPPLWGLRPPSTLLCARDWELGTHRSGHSHGMDRLLLALPKGAGDAPRCSWLVPIPGGRTQPLQVADKGERLLFLGGASTDTEVPPSLSLWCPRHLQALRDSHLQAKEAQDPPASTLPTGTCSAKDGHDEGAGPGTTRGGARLMGRGFSSKDGAKVTEWRPAWGHEAQALMVRLAVAFQGFPSWRLVGPQEPLGAKKPSICVVFKSDSHGSMTHSRTAERQKLRSACTASAGPPGPTARLTWKKHMKEPLAIRPVPSLLSQVLPASHRKTPVSE